MCSYWLRTWRPHMYTPFAHAFAYAIKQTLYAFVAKIILCMYLLYVVTKKRELPNIFDDSVDFVNENYGGPSGCSTWVPSTHARVSEEVKVSIVHAFLINIIQTASTLLLSILINTKQWVLCKNRAM